ncbi:MAG: proton-conducting transporter membrane subunit, partial [Propionibacteriaceae bacterium]
MNLLLEMQMPVLNLVALAPILLILTSALISVLIEAFVPQRHRHPAQVSFTAIVLLATLALAIMSFAKHRFMIAAAGALSIDAPATMAWILLLFFALLSVMLFAERGIYRGGTAFTPMAYATPGSADEAEAERRGLEHTEIYPLLLFSLGGMMMFAAATDFIMLFVALEVMSLPLYLLAGLARRRRLLSLEASIKYFLLGSVSSAIMLFGVALLYGYSGSFRYGDIAKSIIGQGLVTRPQQGYALVLAGLAMVAAGLLFKIGAVPFHMWTPDVYQGSPTPVTAFMAICTKLAA